MLCKRYCISNSENIILNIVSDTNFICYGGSIKLTAEDTYYIPVPNYSGPAWHVCQSGSDINGDGSSTNPFETIMHAINAASSGDTVYVAAGTYYENVEFSKSLVLIGAGIQQTIIDAGYNGIGIGATGNGLNVRVEGFSVRHASSGHAAIFVNGNYHNASVFANILNNEVYDNTITGIYIVNDHGGLAT